MSVESPTEQSVDVKVADLDPRSRRINVIVKVVSKSEPRETVSRIDGTNHRVVDALVGDETGSVYMTLWDDNIEKIKENDVIKVKNAYVSLFKGSMRLNIGRFGSFESAEVGLPEVNTTNNLSDKQYEQERRPFFRPRFSGGDQGFRRGRRDFGRRY